MTLVDTNVLLDILTADLAWADWSVEAIDAAATAGPVYVNDVIYAELAARFDTIEALDAVLAEAGVDLVRTPRPALFLAAKAFLKYRAAGGARSGVLPDFFIGAHAAVAGWRLLTRDAARYRSYFPSVSLVTPASR